MDITAKAAAMAKTRKAADKPTKEAQPVPTVTGPEIPMAIHTEEATVVVYGHQYVSKRDAECLAACLTTDGWEGRQHGIRVIRYLADGRPVGKDGQAIFANCSVELGGVLINLKHTFDKAVELCVDEPNRGIWGTFHQMMLQSYLHEASHISARLTAEDREAMAKEDPIDEERLSEKFSLDMLFHMAKNINIEPGHYTESPYFVTAIHELFETLNQEDEWVKNQQHMLENNIFYNLPAVEGEHTGLQLTSFKSIIQLISDDSDSEDWEKNTIEMPGLNSAVTDAVGGATAITTGATVANVNTMIGTDAEFMDYDDGCPFVEDTSVTTNGFGGPGMATFPTASNNPGNATFPVGPTAAVADQNQQQTAVYPQTGLSPEQTGQIVQGVYQQIYNHIFTHCQRLLNSDVAFARPEAVAEIPIMLSEDARRVVVKCECQNTMGQMQQNVYTSSGELRGYISSKAKLPMYKIYINNNGVESVRVIMPQNPAKASNGQYSNTALQARGGSCIMYVLEGNEAAVKAGAKKWLLKIVDGQLMAG